METLARPTAPANMEIHYTDKPDSQLPQHTEVPPEQAEWDKMSEYVGSSDEERTSQNYLLDPSEDSFRGGLLSRSQVYLPSDDECSARNGLLRDHSPHRLRPHPQNRPQDHPQQMLDLRSFQWAGFERCESAIAEPSVDSYDDDDDVQRWHYFVGESRSEWDEVQVMALIAFVVLVYFVGAVMVWVMVT